MAEGTAEGIAGSTAAPQTHFARRATGFVRDIKVRDAVIFNVLPACPGLVMALSVFWVLSTFTGVNLYVGILITIVCAFLISGAFGLLSQIMPRSGGDYILISRSLHPGLAIGSSILIGTSAMLAMGYWGVFTANICIGPMLTMFGVSVDSHWLQQAGVTLTHHPWNMLIGFIEVAILANLAVGFECDAALFRMADFARRLERARRNPGHHLVPAARLDQGFPSLTNLVRASDVARTASWCPRRA